MEQLEDVLWECGMKTIAYYVQNFLADICTVHADLPNPHQMLTGHAKAGDCPSSMVVGATQGMPMAIHDPPNISWRGESPFGKFALGVLCSGLSYVDLSIV